MRNQYNFTAEDLGVEAFEAYCDSNYVFYLRDGLFYAADNEFSCLRREIGTVEDVKMFLLGMKG